MDAPDLTLRYDEHADGLVDLHLPSTAGPSVLLLHGGFWKQQYDRTYLYPMARALAELGYVVATPEYRRAGGGGGWPATWHDVDSVTAALPVLCADTGVAWQRPVAVGHSTGGHLALLLAGSDRPLAGVVGLGPVCHLRAALDMGLGSGAAAAFLDGTDPSPADPMDHPAPAGLRVELVHGLHDEDVPIALSRPTRGRIPRRCSPSSTAATSSRSPPGRSPGPPSYERSHRPPNPDSASPPPKVVETGITGDGSVLGRT